MPSARVLSLIAVLALGALFAPRAARAESSPLVPPHGCRGAIQHPLEVKVEALDPVRRGQAVRVRLTTRSSRALEHAEVRLVHTGGASLISLPRVALGTLAADAPAAADFEVLVPRIGRRALLQFVVLADEDGLRLGRGATLNLLPDGPQRPASIVPNADGGKTRVYTARRVDQ